ncbi:MAG: efflux RND transporter permease subunit, partial [Gammaproteobacteria bacterium]|nr:efflux RND transporter permease subunit [Gammaproteobacteria bacterium]
LGIGMLVDSTIVMLENIYRHQREGETSKVDRFDTDASIDAASEVNSAIVASTSTNLAAVLPFLFITGLVGLLFRELIFTISAAIAASMLVALTLVPALAGRIQAKSEGLLRRGVNRVMDHLRDGYAFFLGHLLKVYWLTILLFMGGLVASFQHFSDARQVFLPNMDEGRVSIYITADRGINLSSMNRMTSRLEQLMAAQPEVESIFTIVGGNIFGRSQHESPNRASIKVQLKPRPERGGSSMEWIKRMSQQVAAMQLAGVKVRMRMRGIRGIRLNRSDDDLAFRIKGAELHVLEEIAHRVAERLSGLPGLRNVQHSSEDRNQELSVEVDRERAAAYGLAVEDVGKVVRFALEGSNVTDFITDDRSIDVLLRLDRSGMSNPSDVENIILFSNTEPRVAVRLSDIAQVNLVAAPAAIMRDQQQRIVEVSAGMTAGTTLSQALDEAREQLKGLEIPAGYSLYEAGSLETLQEGQDLSMQLLMLALFLVFVVMAVQYESLRNPLVIILSVPFASIGVMLGLEWTGLPVSMPVWLGLIMLAGIVVNNSIVLVEYIEIERSRGMEQIPAIIAAAHLRLRPILMTTLTTVVGMLPLALALGEGSEMLQPLAVTIVSGLLFSSLVSLLLVPSFYRLLAKR